ncbi:MAG: hypothetical protein ABIW46_00480 [Acidimicrobiales bacterium]
MSGRLAPGALAAAVVVLGGLAAGCGGGGGGRSAACDAFVDVQRSLRAATLDASPAALAAVDGRLRALGDDASDGQAEAADQARKRWAAYRAAATRLPRDEFAVSQAYSAALRALDPFTAACGSAL